MLKNLTSNCNQLVFVLTLLFLYLIYFSSRILWDPDVVVGWFVGIYFGILVTFHPGFSVFLRTNFKKNLVFSGGLLLIYSFFFYRTNSWDGSALYFRNAFLVSEKGFSGILHGALWPYLSELVLGLTARYLSYNFMFLLFGIASIAGLYTAYLLYKRLGFSSFVIKSSLLILVSSPTYIMLAIHEFKVELFLLVFTNLFLLTLVKAWERPSHKLFVLLGFLASLSFLVKISVLPLVLFAPVLLISVIAFKRRKLFFRGMKYLGMFSLTFSIPIFMWLLYTPANLPVFGDIDLLSRKNRATFDDLDRDSVLLAQCTSQGRQKDLSGWIYFKNELWILIQPFQFFFLTGLNKDQFVFHTGNPGPYIYSGIWLLSFVSLIFYRQKDFKKFLIYASSIPFIMIIYYLSKSVFWYFFPVYPLVATAVPVLAERYIKTGSAMSIFKITLLSLVFTHALWGITAVVSLVSTAQNLRDSSPIIYDLSKQAQNLPGDSYILDAAQHQFIVFLPFMSNYDTRVVRSNYYFASSDKTIDEMRQELLDKNIKYII
ncbi:glycosyltransferase family 39 protein, partial [Patescibacteria group bacterium]|nr:glycosyltransferase family 39 protein [Patescibacteria group bacterium]